QHQQQQQDYGHPMSASQASFPQIDGNNDGGNRVGSECELCKSGSQGHLQHVWMMREAGLLNGGAGAGGGADQHPLSMAMSMMGEDCEMS
ncbi:hypothetical protein HDU76_010611, partial [Blyttiomyces sp. JEL0837]